MIYIINSGMVSKAPIIVAAGSAEVMDALIAVFQQHTVIPTLAMSQQTAAIQPVFARTLVLARIMYFKECIQKHIRY